MILLPRGFAEYLPSTNGASWVYPGPVPTLYVDVGGIAFGNGTYVAAGYKRTGKPTDLWSSTGMANWQFRDAKSNQNMFGVGYGLGQFVAVGQGGTLITSPEGAEWTLRAVPHTGFIWDVCAGGGYLAAACQWGRVLTSPNGIDWTKRETGAPDHLTDIAFGNGTFIAVGWKGQIVQSESIAPPGTGETVVLADVSASDRARFISRSPGRSTRRIKSRGSTDLRSWTLAAPIVCNAAPMNVTLTEQIDTRRFYRVVKP